MIEEDIEPDDHHTREMYARYGLAMYFAQVVEAGIKNALILAQFSSQNFATLDDFDESWALNFKVTMGKLLQRFEPFLGDDNALGEDLELALAMRNQLAHHFFWDHAADAVTVEGRDRMMNECVATIEFFQELERRLTVVAHRYSAAAGTAPSVFTERIAASFDELLSDYDQAGSKNCGRCMTPMEAVGSARRPYWKCPSCGSVAIT